MGMVGVRKGIRPKPNSAKTKMTVHLNVASENARASPECDVQGSRLTPVRSEQGLPRQGRAWPKKLVQNLRAGTLNVGSMIGRGRELADLMERRKVGGLCVQETRWRGNKSRDIGAGCKLAYSGANAQGRNGVGIVLDSKWREDLVSVGRRSDRIMSVKLGVGSTVLNVVCAYAPQVGCTEE
ncbi:uncharacterized protein LOC106471902 [Limulus polyphemus]|uniref:Uncharacterized protein LOC106471902 n=1 Tax=Limulus polyphemus TaxID=6850 RepID=A0ABM1BST8_LIMPO|nr:uncharacterized protein LOC106471902 [Limulus polyphemus]